MRVQKNRFNVSGAAYDLCIHLFAWVFSLFFFLFSVSALKAEVLIPIYIEKGTNLITLTRTYCTSEYHWKELAKINNLTDPYIILAGDTLYAPLELVKTEKVVARVASVIGGVYILQHDDSLDRIRKGDTIFPGQTIVTEEDGFAHLIFPDNRYTRIASDSKFSLRYLVRLVDQSLKAEFFLEKGRITHSVKKRLKANETFSTRTPVSVTGVRGTEFRLKVLSSDANIVETLSGVVGVNSSGANIEVKKGEGLLLEKGKEIQAPKKLPAEPPSLEVEEVYKSLPIEFFAPEGGKNISHFRIRLTQDPAGTDTILAQTAKRGEKFRLLALEDGKYFGFLTALNEEGLESPSAPPVTINVRTIPGPPIFTSLHEGKIIFEDTVQQTWLDQENATKYRVQLATDNKFENIIDERLQDETVYNAEQLKPGKYFLRINSVAEDGFESLPSLTDSWVIREKPTLEGFTGSLEDGVRLKWASMGDGIFYELQLAKDKEFLQLLSNVKGLQNPEHDVTAELEPGTYFVRVRGVMDGGQISPWTPYQVLKVPPPSFGLTDALVLVGFLSLFLL